ncbi:MAG TPA: SDR family oxidoreductase [Deltaproteobacteria bacterium]|jgi:NAD(P)-dependent dehydrogenase (short-subunit alcohol dehydrogenase family)|nr:SDR family oxidoreductase [Deltaproteobacteria bacterium]HOI08339.1 SDR family oxidoreductase [Deltaproteobacteria bacterium]
MVLNGKAAIVTGAGRGLGRAISKAFAREGVHVMMMSLDEHELKEARQEVAGLAQGEVISYTGNVAREPDVAQTVAMTVERFGRLDILVNNAGIVGPPRLLEDTDLTSWNITLGINLTGYFLFTRAVLPHMVRQGSGKIINIVSGLGEMPFPRFCAYSVSKAGGIQLTRSVSSEMEPYGIQVNAIDPGVMDTSMHETIRAMGPEVLGEEIYAQFMEFRDTNVLKSPDDVAPLAVFLASPASDHLTGRIGTLNHYRGLGFMP